MIDALVVNIMLRKLLSSPMSLYAARKRAGGMCRDDALSGGLSGAEASTIFLTLVTQMAPTTAAWGEQCDALRWGFFSSKPKCASIHAPTGMPLTCAAEGPNEGYCTLVSYNKARRGGVTPQDCVHDNNGNGCIMSHVVHHGGLLGGTRTEHRATDKLVLCNVGQFYDEATHRDVTTTADDCTTYAPTDYQRTRSGIYVSGVDY